MLSNDLLSNKEMSRAQHVKERLLQTHIDCKINFEG